MLSQSLFLKLGRRILRKQPSSSQEVYVAKYLTLRQITQHHIGSAAFTQAAVIRFPLQYEYFGHHRAFSSRPPKRQNRQNDRNNRQNGRSGEPVNDRLVQILMTREHVSNSDYIKVMCTWYDEDNQENSSEMSLTEAIKLSVEFSADLVGIALNDVPPVVRVETLSKLKYRLGKEKKKADQIHAGSLISTKEVQISAGIAEGDLLRKIETIDKFTGLGNTVNVHVRSRQAALAQLGANATEETVDKIILMCTATLDGPVSYSGANKNSAKFKMLQTQKQTA
jgi:translation initiation factor IF-3